MTTNYDTEMELGTVKFFGTSKGPYGFLVTSSGEEVYFHWSRGMRVASGSPGTVVRYPHQRPAQEPVEGEPIRFYRQRGKNRPSAASWYSESQYAHALRESFNPHSLPEAQTFLSTLKRTELEYNLEDTDGIIRTIRRAWWDTLDLNGNAECRKAYGAFEKSEVGSWTGSLTVLHGLERRETRFHEATEIQQLLELGTLAHRTKGFRETVSIMGQEYRLIIDLETARALSSHTRHWLDRQRSADLVFHAEWLWGLFSPSLGFDPDMCVKVVEFLDESQTPSTP